METKTESFTKGHRPLYSIIIHCPYCGADNDFSPGDKATTGCECETCLKMFVVEKWYEPHYKAIKKEEEV